MKLPLLGEEGVTLQTNPQRPLQIQGFFRSLYDFSFREFVTPRIIQIVYVIALIAAALWSAGLLFSGVSALSMQIQMQTQMQGPNPTYSHGNAPPADFSGLASFLQIVGAPVLFVILSIVARIQLEFLIAVFTIADNVSAMRRRAEAQAESPTAAGDRP